MTLTSTQLNFAAGIKVPEIITTPMIQQVAQLLGINIPIFKIAEAVDLAQARRKANPNLDLGTLLRDPELQLLIKQAANESCVAKCPSCGFVEQVALCDPKPCARCGLSRQSD